MPDRLHELLRQRALLQEHLAWLDREIAAAGDAVLEAPPETGTPGILPVETTFVPAPAPSMGILQGTAVSILSNAAVPAEPVAPLPPEVAQLADTIIDEYRVPPKTLHTDVKKGCFLYFFAALGLVILAAVAFYFAYHHD